MLSYSEKLRDPRWQRRRLEVMNAADWRCEDCRCARDAKPLDVHHCAYLGQPWEADDGLLMALCRDCHAYRQEREDAFRVALGQITRRLPARELDRAVWRVLMQISEGRCGKPKEGG
jgi:hypothetical protein